VASLWSLTSCVALAARAVRWRISRGEEFREEVERFTDAERVILADANQALLRYGLRPTLPRPSEGIGSSVGRDSGCHPVHSRKGEVLSGYLVGTAVSRGCGVCPADGVPWSVEVLDPSFIDPEPRRSVRLSGW
jgi:hypothetical protein